jgi:hypothetical protein
LPRAAPLRAFSPARAALIHTSVRPSVRSVQVRSGQVVTSFVLVGPCVQPVRSGMSDGESVKRSGQVRSSVVCSCLHILIRSPVLAAETRLSARRCGRDTLSPLSLPVCSNISMCVCMCVHGCSDHRRHSLECSTVSGSMVLTSGQPGISSSGPTCSAQS